MTPSMRDLTETLAMVWTVPMVSSLTGIGWRAAAATVTGTAGRAPTGATRAGQNNS